MGQTSTSEPARLLWQRLNEIAQVTDEPGKLTRTFLSPAMGRANGDCGRLDESDRTRDARGHHG